MDKLKSQILLVEDEPALQFVMEQQLLRLGYTVAGLAENGLVALEKALTQKFDVIFMDVRMPEIDGLLATQRIRDEERKRGTHTIIIGMTAFAEREKCLEVGMDVFCKNQCLLNRLKPCSPNGIVRNLL